MKLAQTGLVKEVIEIMQKKANDELVGKQIDLLSDAHSVVRKIFKECGMKVDGSTAIIIIDDQIYRLFRYDIDLKKEKTNVSKVIGTVNGITFQSLAEVTEQSTIKDLMDAVQINSINNWLGYLEERKEEAEKNLNGIKKDIKKFQFEKLSIKASSIQIKDFTATLENIVGNKLVDNDYFNELNLLLEVKRILTDNLKMYGLEFSTSYVLLEIEDESHILFTYDFTHETTEADKIKLQGITMKPVIPMSENKTLQDLVVGVRSKAINKRIELLKKLPNYHDVPNNEVRLNIEKLEAELKSLS